MNVNIDIVEKVKSASKEIDGKKQLNCSQAFALADELGVSVRKIGNICNEQDVRICNCQLGCFK